MPLKRASKPKAAAKRARPSPALSMMVESPVAGGPSCLNATSGSPSLGAASPLKGKAKPFARFGFMTHSFGVGEAANGNAPPSTQTKQKHKAEATGSDLLWCDSYAPRLKTELAVHKKKVEQVEGWLREALDGRAALQKYRRILVLSGPSGSGKSSLVKLLSAADQLNFQVIDWTSEDLQGGLDSDYYWDRGKERDGLQAVDGLQNVGASLTNKFGLFLSNASRYGSLAMEEEEDYDSKGQSKTATSSSLPNRRVILLEDLPNVNHPPTRTSFNAALDAFLQQSGEHNTPLVLIMSDTIPRLDEWGAEGSSRSYRDRVDATLTVRNLIPPSIRRDVGFTNIEFNAVAPTIITKALKRVLELAGPDHSAKASAISSRLSKDIVEAVVEGANGDIRSAVNTLQIVYQRGDPLPHDRGTKRGADGSTVKSQSKAQARNAVAVVSGRESSLVLFHALGKVLYNKRVGDPDEGAEAHSEDEMHMDDARGEQEMLPPHWTSFARRRSRVDVEMLWRSMPVDSTTLQAFLHQNYPPFCTDIEQCAAFSDNVSLADSLRPAHEEWFHTPLTDYYGFLISVHGSLLALPSPVPRKQVRKMGGVALFRHMKTLRENKEALADVQTALQEEAIGQTEGLRVLSESSATILICEILPLISKSQAMGTSPAVQRLVQMPWVGQAPANELADESADELAISIDEAPRTQQSMIQSWAEEPATGRPASYEGGSLRVSSLANTLSEQDCDDDIEDCD